MRDSHGVVTSMFLLLVSLPSDSTLLPRGDTEGTLSEWACSSLRLRFPCSPLFSPHIPSPPLTSCPPFLSICVLLGAPPPSLSPAWLPVWTGYIYIRNADGGFEAIFHLVSDWLCCCACLPSSGLAWGSGLSALPPPTVFSLVGSEMTCSWQSVSEMATAAPDPLCVWECGKLGCLLHQGAE